MSTKKALVALMGAALAALAGCAGPPQQAAGATEKYTIVLSNNYMGNEWRPQMVNGATLVAGSPEYRDIVDLQIRNVDTQPNLQIASLQTIIRQKPDAILVDAASPTALNPTLEQACAQGIKVIAFDQIAQTPCAHTMPQDYAAEAADMVNWLGTVLQGKGNILMDTGLPGIPISTTFVDVWTKTLAEKYPDIKVVGTYSSQYAPGPELQGVSQQLAANTRIDGILSGGYISSQIAAFEKAGRTPVPATGLDINGNMQECERLKLPCFYIGAPAFVGGMAVEQAVKILRGETVPKDQVYWDTNYLSTAADIDFPHQQKAEVIKEGESYFATGSPSLVTPVTYGPNALTAAAVLGS
ncbi:substrate-binding domain-containing protein [Pseudonocardia kujensis]|uniref:substrate-binding domain-containing protein n=1 Tax=Pseudonocardia kujensis TaxID=1128675 RepID=UPI001E29CB6D|nr:substrate-binding domain-containing protein [Pseudonocardia kujensis]MCE0764760.1 substrate-binding domain-containing protein [Pseudonocardia kujensis]